MLMANGFLDSEVFWWKYFLCTDVRVFPEPRQFQAAEAIARWSVQVDVTQLQKFCNQELARLVAQFQG